jgi:hypothetical protein
MGARMRTAVGWLTCLTAMTSVSFAGPQGTSAPTLSGAYPVGHSTWQFSDSSPWTELKNAPWVSPPLVKSGYVPFTHDSQHYYCRINRGPQIGSHVIERTFMCTEPFTGQWLFRTGR